MRPIPVLSKRETCHQNTSNENAKRVQRNTSSLIFFFVSLSCCCSTHQCQNSGCSFQCVFFLCLWVFCAITPVAPAMAIHLREQFSNSSRRPATSFPSPLILIPKQVLEMFQHGQRHATRHRATVMNRSRLVVSLSCLFRIDHKMSRSTQRNNPHTNAVFSFTQKTKRKRRKWVRSSRCFCARCACWSSALPLRRLSTCRRKASILSSPVSPRATPRSRRRCATHPRHRRPASRVRVRHQRQSHVRRRQNRWSRWT